MVRVVRFSTSNECFVKQKPTLYRFSSTRFIRNIVKLSSLCERQISFSFIRAK